MVIRPMTGDDDLMPFLIGAMDWRDEGAWDADTVLATPGVAHYIVGWMREGDAGVLATHEGAAVGAAWWRTFDSEDRGYGYVAHDVPEIGLAVLENARGKGVGTRLLAALVDLGRSAGLRGLSLSVEDGNDGARRLYEGSGFVVCGRDGNSDTMVLWLR